VNSFLNIIAILVCAVLVLCTGCESRAKREKRTRQEDRAKALREATSDWFMRFPEGVPNPIDMKVLIAVKYNLPEQAVRDFVDAFATEHDFARTFWLSICSAPNAAEVRAMKARLDAVPLSISNTITTISQKYGIDSRTLGALLVDYYTWEAAEQRTESR
jgi:hypothetical protein